MILRALYDLAHTERLVDDPDYVQENVAYYLSLGEGGSNPRLVLVAVERQEGNRTIVDLKPIPIPRELGRQGTKAPPLFLLDNSKYLFGLGPESEGSSSLKVFDKEFQRFRDRTRDVHASLLSSSISVPALNALLAFLDSPAEKRHEVFRRAYTDARTKTDQVHLTSKLIYIIYSPEGLTPLHWMPAVQTHWREQRARRRALGTIRRCLVTGHTGPMTDRHTFLKKVPGATSSGVPFVSFNKSAFQSYGFEGNANASIGQDAAEGYAAALNRLLHDKPRRADGEILGRQNVILSKDTIALFWSRKPSDFSWLCALADSPDSVRAMLLAPQTGRPPPLDDPDAFFTLVLSGAEGRVVVRSFVTTTTAEIANNVRRYLDEASIDRPFGHGTGTFPLRPRKGTGLLRSLAALGDDSRLPPDLATQVYLAAVTGRPLPFVVLESAVRRNRIEGPAGEAFAARCSLIRISLIRHRAFKEEPTVSLDLNNRQPAYLLGRLLAVIDHVQQDALGRVNATLVDRYYGSASSTPGAVFPTLLRRYQHHLGKLRREKAGLAVMRDKILQDTMAGLGSFPRTLTLQAQGLFALGFHHQRQAFFTKSKSDEVAN